MINRLEINDGFGREYLITITPDIDVSFSRRELWIEITEYANNKIYRTLYHFATVDTLETALSTVMTAVNSI